MQSHRVVSLRPRHICLLVLCGFAFPLCFTGQAQGIDRRNYDLPGEAAARTLKLFSEQSGRTLSADSEVLRGVMTNRVKGEMTPQEAVDLMLAGTPLMATADGPSGAFVIRRRPNPNAPRVAPLRASDDHHGKSAAEEETVTLSPFVITSDKDVGYVATSTLAGSRLKTDFKDLASQVAVMTPEFLADIGAVNNDDAFLYSANTETGAEIAGMAAQYFGSSGIGNSAPNRTRGLGGASNTRNFFKTDIPNDVYNTGDGGLTIASGPNAILFGLGAPAGLADSRYNTALLTRPKHQVYLATDANGSRRGSIDYNQPLVRDRLGVRLDLLDTDRKFSLKPAYEKDRRAFATLGYSPHRRVRIDLFTELMDRRTSRPIYVLPKDKLSLWVNPGMGNRRPYNQPDQSPTALGNTLTTPNATSYFFNWVSGQEIAPTYTYGANVTQPGVYSYRYTPALRTIAQYLSSALGVAQDFPIDSTLTDERFYPFSKFNVYGGSHPSIARAKRVMVQTTVNLATDLYLEAGVNFETRRERSATFYAPSQAEISIDGSGYLYPAGYVPLDPIAVGAQQASNRATNAANRVANPRLGTYFLQGTEQASINQSGNKEARASLAYLFDATKRYSAGWLSWLGRHNLSSNVSYSEVESIGQNFRRLIKDDGSINPATGFRNAPSVITAASAKDGTSATGGYMVAANRQFSTRAYIDPNDPAHRYDTLGGLDPFGTWTFTDAAGKPYEVGLFDVGGTSAANGRRASDLSKSIAWQGFLLKNRVVLTYGRRWDSVRLKVLDPVVGGLDLRTGLAPVFDTVPWQRYGALPTLENTSKSVVVHPLKWVSLFYNLSTNNEAQPSAAHDIDGALYPVPTGDNKDYGVRFQFGGVGLRINQFRTAQTNADAGNLFGNQGTRRDTAAMESRYIQVQRARSSALGLPAFSDYYLKSATKEGYNPVDNTFIDYYRVYTDSLARGTEIELSGRVSRLDLRVAVGRTKSVKNNIGPQWLNYATNPVIVQRMETLEWYAYDGAARQNRPVVAVNSGGQIVFGNVGATPLKGWKNIRTSDTGTGADTTLYYLYTSTVLPSALKLRQFNGMSNPTVREWRFNSTLAYNLGAGWRGGFSARLREKALIGYATRPITLELAGVPVTTLATDVSSPLFNERAWYFDPFLSYTTRIGKNQRITARLNVKNVLNNNDIFAVQKVSSTANTINVDDPRLTYYGWTDPMAITNVAQVQDPREMTLSLSLEF